MDESKESIYELLKRRHTDYLESTEHIFEIIGPVIFPPLYSCLNIKEDQCEWQDLELVQSIEICNEPVNYAVIVHGFLSFKEGERVIAPTGVAFEVDAEMAESFQQPLNLGIPLELIEEANEEVILQFFIESIRDNFSSKNLDPIILPENSVVTPMAKTRTNRNEFNINELTPEQKDALKFYEMGSNNNNEFNS